MFNQIDKTNNNLTSTASSQEHPESVLLRTVTDYNLNSSFGWDTTAFALTSSPKKEFIPGSWLYNVHTQQLTDPAYRNNLYNEGQKLANPNNFFGAVDFLAKKVGNKLLSLANLDMNNIYNTDWNKNSVIKLLNYWEKLDLDSLEPYLGGFKAGGAFYKTSPIQYAINRNTIQSSYANLRGNFWQSGQFPDTLVILGT